MSTPKIKECLNVFFFNCMTLANGKIDYTYQNAPRFFVILDCSILYV